MDDGAPPAVELFLLPHLGLAQDGAMTNPKPFTRDDDLFAIVQAHPQTERTGKELRVRLPRRSREQVDELAAAFELGDRLGLAENHIRAIEGWIGRRIKRLADHPLPQPLLRHQLVSLALGSMDNRPAYSSFLEPVAAYLRQIREVIREWDSDARRTLLLGSEVALEGFYGRVLRIRAEHSGVVRALDGQIGEFALSVALTQFVASRAGVPGLDPLSARQLGAISVLGGTGEDELEVGRESDPEATNELVESRQWALSKAMRAPSTQVRMERLRELLEAANKGTSDST